MRPQLPMLRILLLLLNIRSFAWFAGCSGPPGSSQLIRKSIAMKIYDILNGYRNNVGVIFTDAPVSTNRRSLFDFKDARRWIRWLVPTQFPQAFGGAGNSSGSRCGTHTQTCGPECPVDHEPMSSCLAACHKLARQTGVAIAESQLARNSQRRSARQLVNQLCRTES